MTNRPARPTFAVTIEAPASDVPTDARLRAALKVLRRRFGLRAVHVDALISGAAPSVPGGGHESFECPKMAGQAGTRAAIP